MNIEEIKKAYKKGKDVQFKRVNNKDNWATLAKYDIPLWLLNQFEYRIKPPMWCLIRMRDGTKPEITCDDMDIAYHRRNPERYIVEELYENDT